MFCLQRKPASEVGSVYSTMSLIEGFNFLNNVPVLLFEKKTLEINGKKK